VGKQHEAALLPRKDLLSGPLEKEKGHPV